MSHENVLRLQNHILRAEARWDRAMARDGYRDDPDEADALGDPFTKREWALYGWADAWRLAVHRLENELDRTPEAARARAADLSYRSAEHTFYEATLNAQQLADHTAPLRTPEPTPKAKRTK